MVEVGVEVVVGVVVEVVVGVEVGVEVEVVNTIGLDLGTKTGWALDDYAAGTWDLTPKKHEGAGFRFIHFEANLNRIHEAMTVKAVYYEAVRRHMGVDAAHIYGGLLAKLQEWCDIRGIPYKGIEVAHIKKMATGKGNAKKEAMVAAAEAKWPHFDGDDNEADARFIREYAIRQGWAL